MTHTRDPDYEERLARLMQDLEVQVESDDAVHLTIPEWMQIMTKWVANETRQRKRQARSHVVQGVVLLLILVVELARSLNPWIDWQQVAQNVQRYISPPAYAAGPSAVDEWGNPTNQALWAYVQAHASEHVAPPEWVVSVCQYETGSSVHWTADGIHNAPNRTVTGTVSSTDWGMCQVNDSAHPDKMEMAKSHDWRQNLEVGWQVLDDCWSRYNTDTDRVWCYNGYGKNPDYVGRVEAVHETKFWLTPEAPYAKLAWPGGKRISYSFGVYPNTSSFQRLGLAGKPHNGVDFVDDSSGKFVPFEVVSTVDGTVTNVRMNDAGVGGIVEIVPSWDSSMLVSYYHLDSSSIAVKVGDTLVVGQKIGTANGSGNLSDGPHLHLEVKFDGVVSDPMQFMAGAP